MLFGKFLVLINKTGNGERRFGFGGNGYPLIRVFPLSDQKSGFAKLFTRLGKRNSRILTKLHPTALAIEGVNELKRLDAGREDPKSEPMPFANAVFFFR